MREGRLPNDTAAFIQALLEERLAADYDLATYDAEQARARLDDADALLDRLYALV